jgi:hypothetical protein
MVMMPNHQANAGLANRVASPCRCVAVCVHANPIVTCIPSPSPRVVGGKFVGVREGMNVSPVEA